MILNKPKDNCIFFKDIKILAAALLIGCICLTEKLPRSAFICSNTCMSEYTIYLLMVRRSRLSFHEISNVFRPCPRYSVISHFSAERSFFFPMLLENIGLLNNIQLLF